MKRSSILACLLALAPGLRAQEAVIQRFEPQVRPPDYIFHFSPTVEVPGRPRIALALSGGGARGVAHIGVLERMEEDGLPVDSITGSSIGAFVGGLYAAGYSGREIEALFRDQDLSRAFLDQLQRQAGTTLSEQERTDGSLVSLESDPDGRFRFAQGLQSGMPIQRVLEALFSRAAFFSAGDFDHLRVPFRALATNLQTGQGKVFRQGDLPEAIRASMTVPGGFRPVTMDGQPYVDGALVENLPVDTARAQFPKAFVVGVDVSAPLPSQPTGNILSVAARSLDLTIERRQWESRKSADFLLRPRLPDTSFTEYSAHFDEILKAGRQVYDQNLSALTTALESRWVSPSLPAGLSIQSETDGLPPPAQEVVAQLRSKSHALTERDVYLALQQLLVHGWARVAWAELRPGPVLLIHAEPWPILRHWHIEADPAWTENLRAMAESALPPGKPFDPTTFGTLLSRIIHERVLEHAPLADVRGSHFDPETGTAILRLTEPRVRSISLEPPAGKPLRLDYLKTLMMPLMGQPLRTDDLQRRVALGQERLDLGELRWRETPLRESAPSPNDEAVALTLIPVPQRKQSLDASLGYETSLGGQWALGYAARNLGGSGVGVDLQAARNRLQQGAEIRLHGPFPGTPTAGLELRLKGQEQRLETVFSLPNVELGSFPWDARVRSAEAGLGGYVRFGRDGTGKVTLEVSTRLATYLEDQLRTHRTQRAASLSTEWDNLDRVTLPRKGLLIRARLTTGKALAGDFPSSSFQSGYGRLRGLWPLGKHLGLDLDLEGSSGNHLPLDRWSPYGGTTTLLGSDSLSLLTPRFAALRLGFPIRFYGGLGLDLELEPRVDSLRLAGLGDPLTGPGATKAQAVGLVLRTTLSSLVVEAGYGFLKYQGAPGLDGGTHGSFHIAIATQPFDLWNHP